MHLRRLVRPFYALQGLSVLIWWLALVLWPETRAPFLAEGLEWRVFRALVLPDALLLAGGSLAAAWRPVRCACCCSARYSIRPCSASPGPRSSAAARSAAWR